MSLARLLHMLMLILGRLCPLQTASAQLNSCEQLGVCTFDNLESKPLRQSQKKLIHMDLASRSLESSGLPRPQRSAETMSLLQSRAFEKRVNRGNLDLLHLVNKHFPKEAVLASSNQSWKVTLPTWILDAPFFSNSETEASWKQLPMPFWEERDVEKTDSENKFQGKAYKVDLSMDHAVYLPSLDDVNKRCNTGRWPHGSASLKMPGIKHLEGNIEHEPRASVIIATRPAGGLWAHWIDNTFLKFAWLYPVIRADAGNWTIYDMHDNGSQKSILEAIELLQLHDVNARKLDEIPESNRIVGNLLTVCDLPSIHPIITQGARRAMLSAANMPDQNVRDLKRQSYCEVAYMIRNGPSTIHGRTIPNEKELYNKIQEYVSGVGARRGFNPFVGPFSFDQGFSLKQTVALLNRGCVFVGAHGAALYHILWAPQNATLIELFPREAVKSSPAAGITGGGSYNVFWSIARALGYGYGFGLYDRFSANYTETLDLLDKAM